MSTQGSVSVDNLLVRIRMKSSMDDLRSPAFYRALIAEFLGTFLLVLVGVASCVIPGSGGTLGIAICFGLAVGTVVWAIAHVSGGHINPAVTLGMLVARKVSLFRAVLYVLCQMVGALSGAAILLLLLPIPEGGAGVTQPGKEITPHMAFGIETLITFILVFTVFGTCDGKRTDLSGSGPLAIGLSVTLCHIPFIQFTGASMNPARSFGPAVVYGRMENHWVYWIGPLLGGFLAGVLYETIFAANTSVSRMKNFLLSSRYEGDSFETDAEKLARRNQRYDTGIEHGEEHCMTEEGGPSRKLIK